MPLIGITQGFSTIVGFNYGARLYPRVKRVLGIAALWTMITAGAGFLVMMIFPRFVIALFSSDTELIREGIGILRIVILFLPFIGVQMLGGGLFQSIGKAVPALILTISRQVLFLVPAAFLLPMTFGLNGVWMSVPVADFLSISVTAVWVSMEIKKFDKTILNSS